MYFSIGLRLDRSLRWARKLRAKQLAEERLDQYRASRIGDGVIGDARDPVTGCVLVCEPVHCAAVNDELVVSAGAIHFLHEAHDQRHWNVRVQRTVAAQQLRLERRGLSWTSGLEAAMNAYHAG